MALSASMRPKTNFRWKTGLLNGSRSASREFPATAFCNLALGRRKPTCHCLSHGGVISPYKLFTFHALPQEPMEIDPHVECDRAIARRVQAADQDPDRAAFRGNCRDAVLGPAGFWPDHDAQGGRLAKPRREAFRSNH